MTSADASTAAAGTKGTDSMPLAGVRICLVFEYDLSHYSRVLREITALQEAGATVQLLTTHPRPEDAPAGMDVTVAPLWAYAPTLIAESRASNALLRRIDSAMRNSARKLAARRWPKPVPWIRSRELKTLKRGVDLFWVSDYLSLPTVLEATCGTDIKVVYETVDLVPEYLHDGDEWRRDMLAGERRDIAKVDGFITACDSYADYYVERYGDILTRRPVVCDNVPDHTVENIRSTARPLRLLFFGSLMFDRPVMELMDAMALVASDATLTFQGKNHIAEEPADHIAALGLEDRVFVLDPCPPEEIVETAAAYDVGIVALRGADDNERRASTSKLFTYMAAGIAVLGSDLPGIARVVSEHHNGLLVESMRPASWAAAIDDLAAAPLEEIDAMKQRSLDAARLYLWEGQRQAFIAEFVRALGPDRVGART